MLDLNRILEHPEQFKKAAENKGVKVDIDALVKKATEIKPLLIEVQKMREQRNRFAKEVATSKNGERQPLIEKGKALREELDKKEEILKALHEEIHPLLLSVPNPAADDVPIGSDESGNKEVRRVGELPQFTFQPKSHDELALALDLYDSKRAVRIAGTRAFFLKGDMVLLEQAVLNYALEFMIKQDFTPMAVPWMVNKDALWGTGYFPWGVEDHYTTQDNQGLIGTSEVSITAYYKDETLNENDLPKKFVGISPCFRREVGSYGKDTKGFIRVHQFNKVEQVVLTIADETETRVWHEKILGFSETLLQDLKLPYRVLLMCTGDMGAGQRKKYDIETWFPSQNTYRETHSASYFNDFQARRLNMRYRAKDGTVKFVYTLNNTVAATPRLLAAILENYQQEDGSVVIPEVLRKYIGKNVIEAQK